VFALGDCAGDHSKPLPPLASVAEQQACTYIGIWCTYIGVLLIKMLIVPQVYMYIDI